MSTHSPLAAYIVLSMKMNSLDKARTELPGMLNDRERRDGLIGAGLGIGLTLATVILTGIALGQQIQRMGPGVGDIITFNSAGPLVRDFDGEICAFEAEHDSTACVLQLKSLMAAKTSMIVEAIDPTAPATYRVHWAGAPGQAGNAGCRKDSDLFVSREGLIALAAAAGGFGVDARPDTLKPENVLETAFSRGQ